VANKRVDDAAPALDRVRGAVGPRLRFLRQQRGAALTQLSGATGISVSTLSRLGARPAPAHPGTAAAAGLAHRSHWTNSSTRRRRGTRASTPPDHPQRDDVPPPDPPTRRAGSRPTSCSSRCTGPAGRRNGTSRTATSASTSYSEGCTLLLGERDVVLTPGEVAELDTHVPHAFSNPTPEPAEVLSLVGPQGERLHVRAQPTKRVSASRR
jgi:hypothetical protein